MIVFSYNQNKTNIPHSNVFSEDRRVIFIISLQNYYSSTLRI